MLKKIKEIDELIFLIVFKNTTIKIGVSKEKLYDYFKQNLFNNSNVLINALIFSIHYLISIGEIQVLLLDNVFRILEDSEDIIKNNIKTLYVNNKNINFNNDFLMSLNSIYKIQINFNENLNFVNNTIQNKIIIPVGIKKPRKNKKL